MNEFELKKQLDLCMGCGYCRDAYGEEGWLETLKTKHVCPVREVLGFDSYTAKGRVLLGKAIVEGFLRFTPTIINIFFQCTLCGNCEAHCISRGLPFVNPDLKVREIIRFFRGKIIREGIKIPQSVSNMAKNILESGNVFGEKRECNLAPYLSEQEGSDTIYFGGCMATFREQQVIQAFDKLASKLSLKVGYLTEEICCGNILLRTGNLKVARKIIKRNSEKLNELGIKTLITSCPGCFSAFKNEYPKFDFSLNFDIKHISEYLSPQDLSKVLKNTKSIKVTYHDPCELGRLNKIYDEPRQLIQTIPNTQLLEPFRSKVNSWCCGAGAGVQAAYPELSQRITIDRYSELIDSNTEYIITACPNCTHALGLMGKIYDLVEFLNLFIIKNQ